MQLMTYSKNILKLSARIDTIDYQEQDNIKNETDEKELYQLYKLSLGNSHKY